MFNFGINISSCPSRPLESFPAPDPWSPVVQLQISPLEQSTSPIFPRKKKKLRHLGVSLNGGFSPKSFILIGFSILNHPFWGTPIFGNTHLENVWKKKRPCVLWKVCFRRSKAVSHKTKLVACYLLMF